MIEIGPCIDYFGQSQCNLCLTYCFMSVILDLEVSIWGNRDCFYPIQQSFEILEYIVLVLGPGKRDLEIHIILIFSKALVPYSYQLNAQETKSKYWNWKKIIRIIIIVAFEHLSIIFLIENRLLFRDSVCCLDGPPVAAGGIHYDKNEVQGSSYS